MGNSMKKKSAAFTYTNGERKELFMKMMDFHLNPSADIFQKVMIMLSQCDGSHPDYEKIVTWAIAVLLKYPQYRSVNSNRFPMTMESLLRVFDSNASPLVFRETMVEIEIPQRIRRIMEIDMLWMAYGATGSPKYIELIQRVTEDLSQNVDIRQAADWSLRKYQRIFPNISIRNKTPSIIIPKTNTNREHYAITIKSPASI